MRKATKVGLTILIIFATLMVSAVLRASGQHGWGFVMAMSIALLFWIWRKRSPKPEKLEQPETIEAEFQEVEKDVETTSRDLPKPRGTPNDLGLAGSAGITLILLGIFVFVLEVVWPGDLPSWLGSLCVGSGIFLICISFVPRLRKAHQRKTFEKGIQRPFRP